jgi:hypothetical protein
MAMRDFFRGDRDRDRDRDRWRESWRDENRYGRQEDQRYSQGRDWGRDEDNEREYGRYGSYAGGVDNPQFYGQSGRSDWRESDYGRGRDWQSQGESGERDWGERDFGDRFRSGEQRGFGGGRSYGGGFYTGETERGGQYGGSRYGTSQYGQYRGGQYGSEAGGDLYREREQGGAGGSRFAAGRVGYGGSGSISSQTGAGVSGMFRGRGPKGYQRSDERIREEVCECLTDDPLIDASNLEVNVKNCEVTLSGTVNSRQEKRRAAEMIEDLSGVKDVHNNLRVASEQSTGTQGSQQTTGTQSTQQPRH